MSVAHFFIQLRQPLQLSAGVRVQVGDEYAVAADNRLVIKFGSAELAVELVKALSSLQPIVPFAPNTGHKPCKSSVAKPG